MFSESDGYERFMGRWSRRLAPLFVTFAGVTEGDRVLDVGSGTGALSAAAGAIDSVQVTGVERSAAYVRYAREHVSGRFEVGDALALPFPADAFNRTLSMLVLNFVADPAAALHQMVRVTRPGGVVAAAVWDYGDGMQMLRTFWDTAVALDSDAAPRDERNMPVSTRLDWPSQPGTHWNPGCASTSAIRVLPSRPGRGRCAAASLDRLAEEQAILRFLADVRQHGVARQPSFEGQAAAFQQSRRRRVVDVTMGRHPVDGGVAPGLVEQQLHHLGHEALAPPSAAEAVAEIDDVRLRPAPAAEADRAAPVPQFDEPGRLTAGVEDFRDDATGFVDVWMRAPGHVARHLGVGGDPLEQYLGIIERWRAQRDPCTVEHLDVRHGSIVHRGRAATDSG